MPKADRGYYPGYAEPDTTTGCQEGYRRGSGGVIKAGGLIAMARITVRVWGIKVQEYETKSNKLPNVSGLLKELERLGIKTKW